MRCASRSPPWRRRAATSSFAAARRGLSQFRDQALERGALCRDERAACAMPDFDPRSAKETLNRWIAHETAKAAREVTAAIEAYRFNDAAGALYRFVWNVYLRLVSRTVEAGATGARRCAQGRNARDRRLGAATKILKLLHPFMPFITEELWAVTAGASGDRAREQPCSRSPPGPQHDGLDDPEAEAEIGWVIDLVTAIRSVRAEMNIPPATQMPLVLAGASEGTQRARRALDRIRPAARADLRHCVRRRRAPQGVGAAARARRGGGAAAQGRDRFRRRAGAARPRKWPRSHADIARVDHKLNNADFVTARPKRWSRASARSARRRRPQGENSRGAGAVARRRLERAGFRLNCHRTLDLW